MKKIISILLFALIMGVGANAQYAQTAKQLAKEQQELQNILRKSLDAKPTKDAKKQAKEYKKQGWEVPAGERSIEQQITQSQFLEAELTVDQYGQMVKRFILRNGMGTAGTFNIANDQARANAQNEVAAMIATELASAVEGKLNNDQKNALFANSSEEFKAHLKSIVSSVLTNGIPVLTIYRRLPNNNFEVQTRLAYDKSNVISRLKSQLKQDIPSEGEALVPLVDSAVNNVL